MATSRSLGTLTLDLIAQIGGFTDALSKAGRQAQDSLGKIQKQFSDFGDSITNILGAIGIGVGLKSVIDTISSTISRMDELGKSAAKVGLPVEQFSALAAAAQMANVNVDTLQMTLGKLAKSEAAATNPASQQAKIFSALGISIRDANGNLKSSTDVMEEYSDKLQKLGVNTTTTAAGIALFGKNYQDLIPFLQQGSAAIEANEKAAADMGAVLSGPAADAAATFDDNLNKIKLAGQGIENQLVQALLPALNEWTNDIVDLAKDHSNMQSIANTLANTLHVLAAGAIEVGAGFKVIAAAAETVVIAVGNAAKNISALYGAFSKQDFSLNPITNFKSSLSAWKDFYKQFDANNQAARDSVSQIWSNTTDDLSKALDAASQQIDKVGNATAPITSATAGVVKLSEAINSIASAGAKTQGGLTKATQQIAALGAAAIKSGENVTEVQSIVSKGIAKLNSAFSNQAALTKLQNALNPAATAQAEAAAKAYQTLADYVAKIGEASDPAQKAFAKLTDTERQVAEMGGAAIKAGYSVAQVQKIVSEGIQKAQQQYAIDLAAPMKAAQDYEAALQSQLATKQAQLDLQVQGMTMGDKELQQAQQLAEIQSQGAKAIADFQKAYQDSVAKGQANATPQQYDSELKSLKDYWSNYYDITKQSQNQINALTGDFNAGMLKGMKNFIEQQQNLYAQGQQFINNFANGFSNAFSQWASGAESAKKAFGDFIDSLFADALKFVANEAIQKFFQMLAGTHNETFSTDALTSGFNIGGSGGGSGGGFWSSLLGAVGSFFGGGKAGGGLVAANTMYRVNENGPEMLSVGGRDFLMMGSQGGQVIPNPTSGRMGGSVVINQYLQPTSTRQTADQVATQAARTLRMAQARNG